jgi:uncharacterized membrane protein
MVSIIASAVAPAAAGPTEPTRLALDANCVSERSTGRAIAVGHQALQEVLLQRTLEIAEHREGREHGQHHRHQRHQGDQGGEGQAAGGQAEAVFLESAGAGCAGCRTTASGAARCSSMPAACAPGEALRSASEDMLAIMPACPCSLPCGARPGRPSPRPRRSATVRPMRARAAWPACSALIVLGLAWELWLAPTGSGTLALKVLPLVRVRARAVRHRMYTYRWLSLLVWLYFIEGSCARPPRRGLSMALAAAEVALCLALFVRQRALHPAHVWPAWASPQPEGPDAMTELPSPGRVARLPSAPTRC